MGQTLGMRRRRPLGTSKSYIDRRPVFRFYRWLLGAEDMHSHYRWNAIREYVDYDSARTLEVGGGDGRISFEVIDHGHTGPILVTEFDPRTLAEAQDIARLGGYSNVTVSHRDLRALSSDEHFAQVLAIDVLEHIDDDELAMREIAAVLEPQGRLVISVPSPRYPMVFGRRFHDELGHVRDGYLIADIQAKLDRAGFDVERYHHYTGKAVSRACQVFYARGIPYQIGVLWAPLVRPFLLRTERDVAEGEGASLALVAVRR